MCFISYTWSFFCIYFLNLSKKNGGRALELATLRKGGGIRIYQETTGIPYFSLHVWRIYYVFNELSSILTNLRRRIGLN